ncbi:hypothetical protein G4Y73_09030 [Wenzhouxiangella sp. XN201]|uniref:HNH endonuclease n=1 Tax=Wenzhouxiangella sp. XN201 TaxID=2710755 RepID=UPI0013CB2588|nr:HNH endonuclease [Wenzhouxiangella sp. XN201]NEZ04286.1 hypothetical protein [Wenzhouxiangella sp. XN201]
MALTDLTERLYDLRRDRSSGYEKPYKPALLLSLIDLVEKGEFSGNRILLTDELIGRYRDYIQVVGGPEDTARIQYPFWHLCGDGIWTILDSNSQPLYRPGENANKAPSVTGLRASMSHAELDEELFNYLQRSVERAVLRNAIISRYFPSQRSLIEVMSSEFLHRQPRAAEAPARYESDPARSQAFAKTIKQVYDFRCAACGIRVRFRDLALVDACHLIPFSESYNDHPTNGIALCKNHHWAMDRHLIAPTLLESDLVWHSSPLLDDRIDGQRPLVQLQGKKLLLPREKKFYPSSEAIAWRAERLASA